MILENGFFPSENHQLQYPYRLTVQLMFMFYLLLAWPYMRSQAAPNVPEKLSNSWSNLAVLQLRSIQDTPDPTNSPAPSLSTLHDILVPPAVQPQTQAELDQILKYLLKSIKKHRYSFLQKMFHESEGHVSEKHWRKFLFVMNGTPDPVKELVYRSVLPSVFPYPEGQTPDFLLSNEDFQKKYPHATNVALSNHEKILAALDELRQDMTPFDTFLAQHPFKEKLAVHMVPQSVDWLPNQLAPRPSRLRLTRMDLKTLTDKEKKPPTVPKRGWGRDAFGEDTVEYPTDGNTGWIMAQINVYVGNFPDVQKPGSTNKYFMPIGSGDFKFEMYHCILEGHEVDHSLFGSLKNIGRERTTNQRSSNFDRLFEVFWKEQGPTNIQRLIDLFLNQEQFRKLEGKSGIISVERMSSARDDASTGETGVIRILNQADVGKSKDDWVENC